MDSTGTVAFASVASKDSATTTSVGRTIFSSSTMAATSIERLRIDERSADFMTTRLQEREAHPSADEDLVRAIEEVAARRRSCPTPWLPRARRRTGAPGSRAMSKGSRPPAGATNRLLMAASPAARRSMRARGDMPRTRRSHRTSASEQSRPAKPGSFLVSPSWNRRFSRRATRAFGIDLVDP